MILKHLPLDQVHVGKNIRLEPEQDLSGLMESIGQHNVLQPILVKPRTGGGYELVAGHRRYAACQARNEATIPAIIRDDITAADIPYLKLIENVQRKEMTPREIAAALDALKKQKPGISAEGLGKLLGKTGTWVRDQYLAARTFDDLLAKGLTPKELARFTASDLRELGRIGEKDRLEAARDAGTNGKLGRGTARKIPKRGGYLDRSGGISIMGGASSLTVRVVCEDSWARDETITALLALKRRRHQRAARAGKA